MSEADFSGIDPARVPEARRRVAALNAYLALDNPSRADIIRYAASIGISRIQFGRLVRVWRNHRDARLLVIGKRGAATRDYGIAPRAKEIAEQVIADLGADAPLPKVSSEVDARCAAANVRPPSRGTIWNYIRKARAAVATPAAGPPRIAISRMWFHMPVADLPKGAMPTLLAAVLLPERIVVAHAISLDPERPAQVGDIIDTMAQSRTPGAPRRPVLLDADDRRAAAAALDRAGIGTTRANNRSVLTEMSMAFAGQLGPLPVIHQRGMARPGKKRVLSRQEEALPADQVVAAIEAAIDSHNAAMLTETPPFDIAPI